jgi:hypothetical protein
MVFAGDSEKLVPLPPSIVLSKTMTASDLRLKPVIKTEIKYNIKYLDTNLPIAGLLSKIGFGESRPFHLTLSC